MHVSVLEKQHVPFPVAGSPWVRSCHDCAACPPLAHEHRYVGKNDKTKVIAKLQKKGAGAPAREPVVSEEEQKSMIAFYHKKQQEVAAPQSGPRLSKGARQRRSARLPPPLRAPFPPPFVASRIRASSVPDPPQAEKMSLENEDAYLHSSWANPKSIKNSFTGVGEVSWKAGS